MIYYISYSIGFPFKKQVKSQKPQFIQKEALYESGPDQKLL